MLNTSLKVAFILYLLETEKGDGIQKEDLEKVEQNVKIKGKRIK